MKYFISKEYVPELKRKLWHVRQGSTVIGVYEEKCTAEHYCNFLNKRNENNSHKS